MRQLCVLASMALGLMLTGCTTKQAMRFHLAVANIDSPNPDLKFYRVTIQTKASNVKSDLQTGFYDANAVRQLYGNVSSNAAAFAAGSRQDGSRVGMHQFLFNPETRQWVAVPENELFTVAYGANAKAVVDTIKAYNSADVAGQQFASVLAAAAGRDVYMAAISAEELRKDERAKLSALTSQLKDLSDNANKLEATNTTPKQAGALVVQAMQATAQQLGSAVTLDPNDLAGSVQKAQQLLDVLQNTKTGK